LHSTQYSHLVSFLFLPAPIKENLWDGFPTRGNSSRENLWFQELGPHTGGLELLEYIDVLADLDELIVTRSTATVHTSTRARLTSVTIQIQIHIRSPDPYRLQNFIICSLAHCQPSLKISCKSFCAKFLTDKQTTTITYPPCRRQSSSSWARTALY